MRVAFNNKKNIKIGFANIFYWFGAYLFLPVLPLFYVRLGLDIQTIGLAMGSYSIGAVIFRIISGKMADQYGCEPVILAGMLLAFASLFGYVFTGSILIILLFRFLHGISSGTYSTSSAALVTLINPESEVKEAISLYSLGNIIGISLATSLALSIYYIGDINLIIFISIVATFIAFVLFPKKGSSYLKPDLSTRLPMRKIIADPFILIPSLNHFSIYLGYGCLMTFLPLFAAANHIQNDLWLFYFSYAISVILMRIFIKQINQFASSDNLIFFLLIIFVAVIPLPIFSHYYLIFALLGLGAGITTGLGTPVLASMVATRTLSANRGVALGFFTTTTDLGVFFGSVVMGIVAQYFNLYYVFGCVFFYSILNALGYFFWIKSQEKTLAIENAS